MQNSSELVTFVILLLLNGNKGTIFQHGKYLNYTSSIAKLYQLGPKSCAKECVYLPGCKSFNWRDFECNIYAEDENTSDVLTVTSSGAVYGERFDAVKVVTDGCKQNTCQENHKCVPLRNSRKTCVKIVCAHAPPVFNFTTNDWNKRRSDVGTVINYVCNTGYQLISGSGNITCRKDGTWDKGEIVCQKIVTTRLRGSFKRILTTWWLTSVQDGNFYFYNEVILICEVTCPANYRYESSIKFCYKFVDSWVKWSAAKQNCEQNGGDLITLDTDDKFNILNQYLTQNHPATCVLTSAKRNESSWYWSNGQSFNVTRRVNPQIPSIFLGQNCLCQQAGYWYSRDCEGLNVYACENFL